MNAETPIELVTLEAKDALAIFTTDDPATALAPTLAKVRAFIDRWERPDVATVAGRKEIASFAHKVTKSKTHLEKIGADLAREAKKVPGKIDATRRHAEEVLEGWRDEVRAPLDAWEKAEEERKAKHTRTLEALNFTEPAFTAARIREQVAEVEAIDPAQHEEFAGEVEILRAAKLGILAKALEARVKADADAAELEALRKEKAARDAKEAEETRKRDEEAAEARRQQELKDAAEKAATAAAAKAKADLEAQKLAEEEATRKREKNTAHRRKINRAAVADLVALAGVTEGEAISLVTLIAGGKIANVSINY